MSAARDIEARALEDTAQTAEKYAFVCALGDWDIPEEARCGLTRAQLANVTHAVVNYVRRVAFNAAVDTRGMSFLPPVPVSDIRRFLLGSASALGIGRLDEIDAIVALVIDRIVVAGMRERMFRGFDRETGMQLPEETRLQLARREKDGLALHVRFLYAYGTIVDFKLMTGADMLDMAAYLLKMAIEAKDLDGIDARLDAIAQQIRVERQRAYSDIANMAERFYETDWEQFRADREEMRDRFLKIRGALEEMRDRLEDLREADDVNGPDLVRLESNIRKMSSCIASMTGLASDITKSNEMIFETLERFAAATVTGSLYDFESVVIGSLHGLTVEGIISMFEFLLLRGIIAKPGKLVRKPSASLVGQASFTPGFAPDAFYMFPQERAASTGGAVEAVWCGDHASEIGDTLTPEVTNAAMEMAADFAQWLAGQPGRVGRTSGYLQTLDGPGAARALRRSTFSLVFLEDPRNGQALAWRDLPCRPALDLAAPPREVSVDDPDEIGRVWRYSDLMFRIEED